MTTPDYRTNEHKQPPAVCSLEQFRTVNGTTEFTSSYQYDEPILTTTQHNHSSTHCHTVSNTSRTTLSLPNMDIPAKLHLEQGATDKDFSYHLDALGSVRLLSDSSKDTAVSYTYLPYGESTMSSGTDSDAEANRYRFTAREFEQAHFTYYRSRYYANRMSRFLKKDTYRPTYNRPLSLNRYLYVEGNPINALDPYGYFYYSENYEFTGPYYNGYPWMQVTSKPSGTTDNNGNGIPDQIDINYTVQFQDHHLINHIVFWYIVLETWWVITDPIYYGPLYTKHWIRNMSLPPNSWPCGPQFEPGDQLMSHDNYSYSKDVSIHANLRVKGWSYRYNNYLWNPGFKASITDMRMNVYYYFYLNGGEQLGSGSLFYISQFPGFQAFPLDFEWAAKPWIPSIPVQYR